MAHQGICSFADRTAGGRWARTGHRDSRAARLAELLLARSEEFRRGWDDHEIGIRPREVKHFVHPRGRRAGTELPAAGRPGQAHALMVYTAVPGSESYEKLRMLSVIGAQPLC
ncbi:MmyB family transcriptional regulator [Micromonospora radicis]|uniref:MmyB family transcriptional regulator n=1 Tax=Micromonospora radicis TaxID=1894971 RepID=UPI003898DEA8